MNKGYIKQLDYSIFTNSFDTKYITVDYYRNGEHNHYTLKNIPDWVKNEKTVRKYLNN